MYNMLKLSRNLFFHEPDPKYMNYYEQGLFNQILASRRDSDSTTSPEVTYFIPVRPGERAKLRERRHVLRRHGDGESHEVPGLDLLPIGGRRDALRQSLHPVDARVARERIHDRAATRYPFEGASTLTVTGNGRLAVMLRVPSWVRRGYTVSVNGAAQRITATPGNTSGSTASGAPATGSRSRCRSRSAPSARSTTRRCNRSSTARRSWPCKRRAVGRHSRDGAHQRLAIQALQTDRRLRLRDDAGGGQADALQRERPDAGRRSSSPIRRRGTTAAVSHVRPAARAGDRVRRRRFRRRQHEAR